MGSRAIPEKYQGLIENIWRDSKKIGRDLSAEQVLIKARLQCPQQGLDINQLPRKRKTQMIIKDARKRYEGLSDEIKEMGRPWTLASLERYYIPLEALPAVLRVWKLRLTFDRSLSNREAKWVARLSSVITDTLDLSNWALIYAYQDETYDLSKHDQNFETFDIDAILTMNPWELATIRWMGKAKDITPFPGSAELYSPIPLRDGDWPSTSVWHVAESSIRTELRWESLELESEDMRLSFSEKEATLLESNDLDECENPITEEAKQVYAHWLMYLRKGQKWQGLSVVERLEVVRRLREWIKSNPWAVKVPVSEYIGPPYGALPLLLSEVAAKPQFKPSELLREVGYEV